MKQTGVNNMEIAFINKNKNGDYYVGYKIKAKREIKGKKGSTADELIIVGIPKDKIKDFCKKQHIEIKESEYHGE